MPFKKQLSELQEVIANFGAIHANPYDTSKHNDTAEKLEKLQLKITSIINAATDSKDFPTDTNNSDGIGYDFEKLITAYEKACREGTLTADLAKELKDKMEAVLSEEIKRHHELSKQYTSNKSTTLKAEIDKHVESIRTKKEKIAKLSTDCISEKHAEDIIIEAPSEDMIAMSELDSVFEDVIEQGIKMDTGANPEIADAYKKALDQFSTLYDAAGDGQQKKWKQAKKEVEKKSAILKEKMDRAADAKADLMKNVPTGGIYRYAEGMIDGKKLQRLDWISTHVTRKTNADTNKQNPNGPIVEFGTNRIFIEIYTATKNAKGEIVYTYSKDIHAPDSKMLQLFGMVQNPYTTEAEGAIPAMVYNDVPKGNLNWSKTLYSPEPKVAVTKEIPDWTDGKVVELIDNYKKQCAAGMFSEEALKLKTEMLAEIEAHQGDLVKQLELIHHKMGDREDTQILLAIWRKKMETWMNEVKSLGEDCGPKTDTPPDPCTDFHVSHQLYEELCEQKMLPKQLENKLKASMKDCMAISLTTKNKIQETIDIYKKTKGFENNSDAKKIVENLEQDLNLLNEKIEKEQEDFNSLGTDCFKEIEILIEFYGSSNRPVGEIDEETNKKLKDIATILAKNPSITATVIGYAAGYDNTKATDQKTIREDIPTDYEPLDNYNSKGEDGKETPEDNWGDLAMIRAHYIRKLLLEMDLEVGSVNPEQVLVELGNVNSEMKAIIKFN